MNTLLTAITATIQVAGTELMFVAKIVAAAGWADFDHIASTDSRAIHTNFSIRLSA